MKTSWLSAGGWVLVGILAYTTWTTQRENQKLSLKNVLYVAEHRLLKDEVAELSGKPTYDQGYRDAIIRMGGPQNPGAYQDGWDDAIRITGGENNYADGYHAAIQQFGYSKTQLCRWLVPIPENRTGYASSGKIVSTHTVDPETKTEPNEDKKE